jgi:hypothetical protein
MSVSDAMKDAAEGDDLHIEAGLADRFSDFDDLKTAERSRVFEGIGRAYQMEKVDKFPNCCFSGIIHVPLVLEEDKNESFQNFPTTIGHFDLQQALGDNSKHCNQGIHIGAAGLVNLGYVAGSKASGGIFFDINPTQKLFWDAVFERLARHENRMDFLEDFKTIPAALREKYDDKLQKSLDPNKLYGGQCESMIHMGNGMADGSFKTDEDFGRWVDNNFVHRADTDPENLKAEVYGLETDEAYAHLHKLAKAGALYATTLDIRDREGFREMGARLDEAGVNVSTIYTSNIGDNFGIARFGDGGRDSVFLHLIGTEAEKKEHDQRAKHDSATMYENFALLQQPSTALIECLYHRCNGKYYEGLVTYPDGSFLPGFDFYIPKDDDSAQNNFWTSDL